MNEDQERRSRIASKLEQIGIEITGLLERITNDPELTQALTDAELLGLDAWKEGGDAYIRAECRNRRARYEAFARRAAASERAELVPVLAERAKLR